jgi:hypothetical protein
MVMTVIGSWLLSVDFLQCLVEASIANHLHSPSLFVGEIMSPRISTESFHGLNPGGTLLNGRRRNNLRYRFSVARDSDGRSGHADALEHSEAFSFEFRDGDCFHGNP